MMSLFKTFVVFGDGMYSLRHNNKKNSLVSSDSNFKSLPLHNYFLLFLINLLIEIIAENILIIK